MRVNQGLGFERERAGSICQVRETASLTDYRRSLIVSERDSSKLSAKSDRLGLVAELRFLYKSERLGLSEKFCHRLVELLAVKDGWDGEHAKAPKAEVLARMTGIVLLLHQHAKVFFEPFLTPTVGGYAQLEWHNAQRDLDIEATSGGWSIVGSESNPREGRVYYEADANVFEAYKLIEAYRWFSENKQIWPMI